jgi:hypothetical protein
MKMARHEDYREQLLEDLKDRDEAIALLNAAWEESLKGDEESQQLFLLALRDVAEAQGVSAIFVPVSASLRMKIICSSENLFFMVRILLC